jgi:hypothetical protein
MESLVDEIRRDFSTRIPQFENLLGSTWELEGVTMSRVDLSTGEPISSGKSPGVYSSEGYWASFEAAVAARDRSIDERSLNEIQNAFVRGCSSIEGYILMKSDMWNRRNPNDQLVDTREFKTSFDDKIERWIPKMSSGRKLDRSTNHWSDYKRVRGIRDHMTIHPKSPGVGATFDELAEMINLFRTGVAGFLIDLHDHFGDRIPATIIRARYAPLVEVVTLEENIDGA